MVPRGVRRPGGDPRRRGSGPYRWPAVRRRWWVGAVVAASLLAGCGGGGSQGSDGASAGTTASAGGGGAGGATSPTSPTTRPHQRRRQRRPPPRRRRWPAPRATWPTWATRSATARCRTASRPRSPASGCPLVWSAARPGMEIAEGAAALKAAGDTGTNVVLVSMGYVNTRMHMRNGDFPALIDQVLKAAGDRTVVWPTLGRTSDCTATLRPGDRAGQRAACGGQGEGAEPRPDRLPGVHRRPSRVLPAPLPAPHHRRLSGQIGVAGQRGASSVADVLS